MSSLRKDLRNDLEKAVVKARDLAEHAATAALQALAVDQPKPFPHMDADARALRNRLRERLRERGRATGDVRDEFSNAQTLGHLAQLAQLVGYEHWHRMLFARFLVENGLLLEPEHQVALSLEDVQELAREEGADFWQLSGSYAQRMLPAVFRNAKLFLHRPFLYAKDVKKKATGILRWQPNVKWTKDRGTEPQRPKSDFPWFWTWDEKTEDFKGSAKFDGNRWNDLHYSNETKQAARAAHEKKGTEA